MKISDLKTFKIKNKLFDILSVTLYNISHEIWHISCTKAIQRDLHKQKTKQTNRIKVVHFYVDGCLHKIKENTDEIADLRPEDSGDNTAWNMMQITDAAGSFLKGE